MFNEEDERAKSERISAEIAITQIWLYANKMLKPIEMSIKSYRGKSYIIEHLYDVDELIKTKTMRGAFDIDAPNLLKQKMKLSDLFMDED